MKPLLTKSCILLSASAVIFLNILTVRKEAILFSLLTIIVVAILIIRSKDEIFQHLSLSINYSTITALLVCSVMGCNFYNMWINSEIVNRFSQLFTFLNRHQIVLIISIIGTLISIPIIAVLISDFSKFVIDSFKKSSAQLNGNTLKNSMLKSFCIVSVIFLIGISAILRANFNYLDDMGRAAEGYRGWENFSRFVSSGLSTMIHMDNYITDITPLTQLIAVLILALAGIILLYVVYERKVFSVWELVSLIPIGLNPYFLECISYKFDAPFMSLSILAAIAPLLLINNSKWKYILSVIIGTIIVCTSYQASSGIFPMIVILISLRMWFKDKPLNEIIQFILNSIIGFGIGLVFFKIVIMIPTDTYVSNALPSLDELFPTIIRNYEKYFNLVSSDFKSIWKAIIILLIICFSLSGLKHSRHKKLPTFVLSVICELLMLLLCFGLYPALSEPLFDPRAMYGFGIFITLLCISTAENFHCTVMKLPAITITWIFFVFSFTYGNALFVQKSYTDFRITQVISDLNDMEIFQGDNVVTVQIAGSIGYSPVIENMNANCKILERLIPITFRGYWLWGLKGFYGYYGLKNVQQDESIDLATYNLPLIKDGMYHTVYGNNNYILIRLK